MKLETMEGAKSNIDDNPSDSCRPRKLTVSHSLFLLSYFSEKLINLEGKKKKKRETTDEFWL